MKKAYWIILFSTLFFYIDAKDLEPHLPKFFDSPHLYWEQERKDPFSLMIPDLVSGNLSLDKTSEQTFLRDLLFHLDIPEESQLIVYSSTSLQLSKISLKNPRAIYFNETVSVGYIPGAKIEVISIDPEYGAIFYIFKIPNEGQSIVITPTKRCMNCHAGQETHRVPGFLIESVVVGPQGGSLNSFRTSMPSHDINYHERFGGWVVTGNQAFHHFGNTTGEYVKGEIQLKTFDPIKTLPFEKYLNKESDLISHLIFEHQAGFINKCIHSLYTWRSFKSQPALKELLEKSLQDLVDYALFKNEPELPNPVELEKSSYLKVFLKDHSNPLKELDLEQKLSNFSCSYMLLSDYFKSLPSEFTSMIKNKILEELSKRISEKDLRTFEILKSHF